MAPRLDTSGSRPGAPATGLGAARATLENGVVFVGKETQTTPAVAINLSVRAGSICDPVDTAGATWLLSRVIDRGTATRSAADIADDLDSRGVSLTVSVTRHMFSIVSTCLTEDFDAVFALLGEMLISPSLSSEEIEKRKGEIITAIRQDEDNPFVRASETLMTLLYPAGHPYGRPVKGTIDIVERLTREQLVRLHAERFAPGELTAVVVGDVEVDRAHDATTRVFGEWRRPVPVPIGLASPPPAATRRRVVLPMMNKAQADVAYGFTTIRRTDPTYYALWLMNHAFGQYSMSGRLGQNIRERQGMAYYVGSSLDANVVEGPLVVRAGVGPENVDRTIAAIDHEVSALSRDGLTMKELDDSRQYLIHALPRSLETNLAIANFLQQADLFDLGVDYDERLPDLLRAVTLEEVNAAARRLLDPDRATVVIAGPYKDAPPATP
jgi:zinc protease